MEEKCRESETRLLGGYTCENEGTKGSAFIPCLECNMHQGAPKTLCDAHSIMFGQHPNLLAHLVADVQNDMSDLLANVLTQN